MPQGFDPEEDAKNAASRDMIGVFGRTHAASIRYGGYTDSAAEGGEDHKYVREVIPRHHTYDSFHDNCYECKSDVKKGVHPSAPKKGK